MIDATLGNAAADEISGTELAAYLTRHGWTLTPSKVDGVSLAWYSAGMAKPFFVTVPQDDRFVDYRSGLAAVLRTLAAIEKRPENEIARSISEFARHDPAFVAAE
jgi:hypothetical protein